MDYESGSTDVLTSAYDTLGDRRGVCRDFAHLAIMLCRAVGIPARYISAYAWQLQPPDFHAVFEAYLAAPGGGGAWYLFDPTRMAALDGLVRIGAGRDAADLRSARSTAQRRQRRRGSGSTGRRRVRSARRRPSTHKRRDAYLLGGVTGSSCRLG